MHLPGGKRPEVQNRSPSVKLLITPVVSSTHSSKHCQLEGAVKETTIH